MVITISKKEIFVEVEKRSSLEGVMIPERFEGVWASEEEGQFLDSYWVEGCTAVVQMMKRYLTNTTVTHSLNTYDADEQFVINAEMPERYNSLLDGNVATDVKMLIACNILNGWLKVKHPESAAKYVEEATEYSDDLRAKLLYRTEPKRTVVEAEADGSSFDMEGYLNEADADTEKMEAEGYLNEADADTEKMGAEGYINEADKDTEEMGAEGYINEADKDTEKMESEYFINKADIDTEEMEYEKYLNAADVDNVVLGDAEGDTYAADRKCCDRNIYPRDEFICRPKGEDVGLVQGWNRKFECRGTRFH